MKASRRIRILFVISIASLVLSACGTREPFEPTITPSSTFTPTSTLIPTPTQKLTPTVTPAYEPMELDISPSYSEDFETGASLGFHFYNGNWSVIDDESGNKVLEQNMVEHASSARIDLSGFSIGVIEYRFRVVGGDNDKAHTVEIILPLQPPLNSTSYVISHDELRGTQIWTYQEDIRAWQQLKTDNSTLLPKGSWNTMRVESQENIMGIFINGHLVLTASDSKLGDNFTIYTVANLIVQFDDFKVWSTHP
jgi:hypothetical protein